MDNAVGMRADGTSMSERECDDHNAELERATAEGMPDVLSNPRHDHGERVEALLHELTGTKPQAATETLEVRTMFDRAQAAVDAYELAVKNAGLSKVAPEVRGGHKVLGELPEDEETQAARNDAEFHGYTPPVLQGSLPDAVVGEGSWDSLKECVNRERWFRTASSDSNVLANRETLHGAYSYLYDQVKASGFKDESGRKLENNDAWLALENVIDSYFGAHRPTMLPGADVATGPDRQCETVHFFSAEAKRRYLAEYLKSLPVTKKLSLYTMLADVARVAEKRREYEEDLLGVAECISCEQYADRPADLVDDAICIVDSIHGHVWREPAGENSTSA